MALKHRDVFRGACSLFIPHEQLAFVDARPMSPTHASVAACNIVFFGTAVWLEVLSRTW